MQTTHGIASRTIGAAHHSGDRKPELAQRRAKEKGSRAERRHPRFLTQRIEPIGARSVTRKEGRGEEYNLVTRANYIHLHKTALNYARLMGRELNHTPEGNTGACIADLYHKLSELEPSLNLNIEMEPVDNRLCFVFWKPHEWGDYSLYWINAKVLETLTPRMRAATMLFFRRLKLATRMETTNDSDDVALVLEWLDEVEDQYDDEEEEVEVEERSAVRDTVASYRKGGKVYNLMMEIEQKPDSDVDLVQTLAEVRPHRKKEKELLEILREGVRFTERKGGSIFQYEYSPFYDPECGEPPIGMERIVRFVYGRDIVRENLIHTLNDEVNSGCGESIPCTCLTLKPDADSVFKAGTFPEEFFAWMDKLLECINEY